MANLFASLIDEMNDCGYTYNDIDFITTLQFDDECNSYSVEVPIEVFETEAVKIDSQDCGKILIVVMTDKSYFNYEYDEYYCKHFWVYYPVIKRPDTITKNFHLS